MDLYIIRIQPQDELTVIIDKIINTQAQRIYLLVPEQSRIAEHVLNLRLLKREADSLGKEIVVVSGSSRVQALALKASLQVQQETDELKQKADKHTEEEFQPTPAVLRDIVAPPSSRQPKQKNPQDTEPIPKKQIKEDVNGRADKGPAASSGSIANFWKKKRPSLPSVKTFSLLTRGSILSSLSGVRFLKYILLSFVAISFVVAGITFYSVLPKAKVYITSFVEDIVLEIQIKGDVNSFKIEEGKFVIPAQIFEKSISKSMDIETSGEKEIKEKARGVIKVYNAYSSAAQTLVATTRFISEEGKLFRTEKTIVVPGAEVEGGKIIPSFTTVEVVAADYGEEYNIGTSSFSIPGFKGTPKYLVFYGESESAMDGGRIGRIKVVSEDDYENTRQGLIEDIKNQASSELNLSIQEGFIVPPGADSISDVEITSTKGIGDEADALTMSASISLKAFAVRKTDIFELLNSDFENRFKGMKLVPNGDELTYDVIETNFDRGILDLKISYSTRATSEIFKEEIREGVLGKGEREVRSFLSSHPNIKEARITFWPFWVQKVPEDVSKIEIIVEP